MSLLKKLAKGAKKVVKGVIRTVAPAAIGLTPVGGAIAAGLGVGKVAGSALGNAARRLATNKGVLRALPGVGASVAGGAVGSAVTNYVDGDYTVMRTRRRRRKGITPKDLTSFKRVARLIDKFSAPVHKLRKSSFKNKPC